MLWILVALTRGGERICFHFQPEKKCWQEKKEAESSRVRQRAVSWKTFGKRQSGICSTATQGCGLAYGHAQGFLLRGLCI